MSTILTALGADPIDPWTHTCWMATTPRSGSTWLCGLLNLAVGLPEQGKTYHRLEFCEHFHPKLSHRYPEYQPRVTKVHAHWMDDAMLIRALPPLDTKIIRLTRKDHIAQVWSMICSSQVGICNSSEPEQQALYRAQMGRVQVSQTDFSNHLLALARWERILDMYFSRHDCLRVEYEDLVKNTEQVVGDVLRWLEVENWTYVPGTLLKMAPAVDSQ